MARRARWVPSVRFRPLEHSRIGPRLRQPWLCRSTPEGLRNGRTGTGRCPFEPQAHFGIVVRAKRRILLALSGKAEEASMGQGALATLIGLILMATSSALATTTAPGAAPGATGGGIGDYWWIILVVLVIAAAIWYYMRSRNRV